jgi:hypothetical protein
MAKINVTFPEPSVLERPGTNAHAQLIEALDSQKLQLNFSFQDELKQELQRFTWFNIRMGC